MIFTLTLRGTDFYLKTLRGTDFYLNFEWY